MERHGRRHRRNRSGALTTPPEASAPPDRLAPLLAFLDGWLALACRVVRALARAAGALILAAAFAVAAEVALRGVLRISLGGADEVSGYAVAIATTWGLALVLLERGHVRVDALYVRLPARAQGLLDLLAVVVLTAVLAGLGQRAGFVLVESLAFGSRATTPLATPLWIPQSLWFAGFLVHLFVAVPLALRAGIAFARGDLSSARKLVGPPRFRDPAVLGSGRES